MTRTGVLSLLIAAYAVTNTHQAYANPIESNPHFLQGGRNMQAYLYESPTTDLTQLSATTEKIFSQFIDSSVSLRLEGHITTDKIYYKANDAVFMDLVMIDSFTKAPYVYTSAAGSQNITVALLDSAGEQVTGVEPVKKLFTTGGPSHGFAFKLPTTISPGQYLIVVSYPYMATVTRTIVVQYTPSDYVAPTITDPYQGFFSFIGTTHSIATSYGLLYTVFSNSDYKTTSEKALYTFTATKQGDTSPFSSVQIYSETTGMTYFTIDLSSGSLANGDIIKIGASAALTDPSSPLTTVNVLFEQEIIIGDSIYQIPVYDFDYTATSIDYSRFDIHFFTESMSDLIPDTPQVVYFRAFLAATADLPEVQFNVTGASLYSYNPNLPSVDIELIQSGISTIKNGYGVLAEFVYDDTKIYFIEWNAPSTWSPSTYSTDVLKYPILDNVILADGTIRVPVLVEGIQTRLSNIEKAMDIISSASFPQYLLNDYTFSKTGVTIVGSTATGVTYDIGYANGFFFVKANFDTHAPDVAFPPLLVFNNFPRPDDFSNLLLDHSNRHLQGLVLESSQSAGVVYPITGSSSGSITFNSAEVSKTFFEAIYLDMVDVFGQAKMDTFQFNKTSGVVDYYDMFNYDKLAMVFRQVPFVPQEDSDYFGKYGPLAEQTPIPDLFTTTDLIDDTKLSYPAVALSIKDKVLESSQDLVLLITTNDYFDPEDIYLLQIKQKERVVYQEILKLKSKLYKEKYIIDADNFLVNLELGAILQVNLYKTTDDYEDFQELIGSQTYCSMSTLASAYPSMGSTDQATVDDASGANVLENRIYDALNLIKIAVPGTTCLLITPDLVQRFTEPLASISIFKKPASAYHVEITTNDMTTGTAVPKTAFIQGNAFNVNLKVKNTITGNYLTDLSSDHFATLFITEDFGTDASNFYKSSFAGKVYLENEVDFEKYKELDPLNQVNQHFATSTGSDQVLDILLTINNLRNSVFEARIYSILGNSQDVFGAFKSAMPKTFERLSQLFGYNFQKSALNSDPVFTASDIRNYAGQVSNSDQVYSNIVDIDGAYDSYRRQAAAFDVYSAITTSQLSNFVLDLGTSYKAFDNKFIAETQLFKNNRKLTQTSAGVSPAQYTTGTHKLGDLTGNFKVIAYTYGATGFGYGEQIISVGSAFQVDFNIPEQIQAGDKINITATVQNYHGLAFTVTPSIPSAISGLVKADFSYADWYKNAQNKFVSQTRSTWPFSSTQTSREIPFQIEGVSTTSNFGEYVEIEFTFVAQLTSNSTSTTIKVKKSTYIVPKALQDFDYKSGSLQTDSYTNDMNDLPSSNNIRLTLTSADLLKTFKGNFMFFPTQDSYLIAQSRYNQQSNLVDKTLVDLISRITLINQFIIQFYTTTKPDIMAMVEEAKLFRIKLVDKVYTFLVRDQDTQTAKGFDNFKYTDQTEGEIIITAHVLMVLTSQCPDLTSTTERQAINDQTADWILTKYQAVPFTPYYAFFTTDANKVDSAPNSQILQAFLVQTLSQVTGLTNTGALLTALVEVQKLIIQASTDLLTDYASSHILNDDPYVIEQFIQALYCLTSKRAANQAIVNSLTEYLHAYQQQYGFVETPMTHTSNGDLYKQRASAQSIFGNVGIDRDVEIAATAANIYKDYYTGTNIVASEAADRILTFLKRHSTHDGLFGSFWSTMFVNEVLTNVASTSFAASQYVVSIQYQSYPAISYKVDGDYLPIVIPFTASELSMVAADAGSIIKFTIGVHSLVNPVMGAVMDGTGSLTIGPIDSVIDYSFSFTQLSDDLDSTKTSQHGLTFQVISLNQTGQLGLAANLGKVFAYEIHLFNQQQYRTQGTIEIQLRPSSCLSIDSTQFALLRGGSKNSPIQTYSSRTTEYYNEFTLYVRGLEDKGVVSGHDSLKFTFYGTQVSSGSCHGRPFEAGYVGTESVRLFATPAV